MATVKTPELLVLYNGYDTTVELSPYLSSLSFKDAATGEADDVVMELADPKNLFISDWYPKRGDTVEVFFGFQGEPKTPAGKFWVDQVEATGPPSLVTIRAASTRIGSDLQSARSEAYENCTMADIARRVCARNGLTLKGVPDTDMRFTRITQNRQSDLAFLNALCAKYGYSFTVRGDNMNIYALTVLHAALPATEINREDVSTYSFTDKTAETFYSVRLAHSSSYDFEDSASFGDWQGVTTDKPEASWSVEGTFVDINAREWQMANTGYQRAVRDSIRKASWNAKYAEYISFGASPAEAAAAATQELSDPVIAQQAEATPVSDTVPGDVYYNEALDIGYGQEALALQLAVGLPTLQTTRVENAAQADRAAKSYIREKNLDKITARITLPGNPRILAGLNVQIKGFGRFDGLYNVHTSTHQFDTSAGYHTEVELKKVIA